MKQSFYSLLGFLFISVSLYGQVDQYVWSRQTKGSMIYGIYSMQKSNGELINLGVYNDSADFNPGSMNAYSRAGGNLDGYLQYIDTNGNYLGHGVYESIGSSLALIPFSAIVDQNDNIYSSGYVLLGTYDLDPGIGIQALSSSPDYVASYLTKQDANNNYLWHNEYRTDSSLIYDSVNNVNYASFFIITDMLETDSSLFSAAILLGDIDLDSTSNQHAYSTGEGINYSGIIMEHDLDGNLINSVEIKDLKTFNFNLDIDNNGDLQLIGQYNDSIDLDPSVNTQMVYAPDSNGIFLLELNQSLQYVSSQTFYGGPIAFSLSDIPMINHNTDKFLTLTFADSIFIPSTSQTIYSRGGNDGLVIKLNASNQIMDTYHFGGAVNDFIFLNKVSDSTFVIHGNFGDSVDMDLTAGVDIKSTTSNNGFLTTMDFNGNYLGSQVIYGGLNSITRLVSNAGSTYLMGHFFDSIDVNVNLGEEWLYADSSRHDFLIKLGTCTPIVEQENITSCSTYTWRDGQSYSASSSDAHHVVQNVTGCDSIYKLDFTYTPDYAYDDIASCQAYTWIDNNTYDSDTNITITVSGVSGCDSIVTLNYVRNYEYSTDLITTCQNSYTWRNGITYTSPTSGVEFQSSNPNGCDTIYYLNLSFTGPDNTTDVITTCQNSYTWINGVTYTSNNNSASVTLQNAQGCDSIVTLDLTFVAGPTGTDEVQACQSYTWIDGFTYTSSNYTATHTLTSSEGCDSIVTLNLTIGYPETSTDVINACNSYTWIDGNTYTSDNNTATYTLQTQYGCDSVVTLDLTIDTVNTGLFRANQTLTAQQNNGTYQWLDCNTGQIIVGATLQYYNVSDSGSYSCIVTYDGCTDTTECFDFASLGLDAIAGIDFKIYPNPNAGKFTVDFGQQVQTASLKIWSMDGKLVKVIEVTSQSKTEVEYQAAPGMYWLEIDSEMGSRRVRISRF